MVAILELPAVRAQVAPLSVEAYEQVAEMIDRQRIELIRGIIIKKVTSSPFHSYLIGQLQTLVQTVLDDETHLRQEQPLKMSDSMPEPDILVVAGKRGDYRRTHPTTGLLAIEVAVTTMVLDHEKAPLYAEAGVQEYWIVLANDEAIEVHTAPADGRYTQHRTYTRGETLPSTALSSLHVDLDTLFAG